MRQLLTLLTFIFASAASQASTFIEPALTFQKGENSISWPSPLSSSTGTTGGMGFNLKFGYDQDEAFFIGADINLSKPTFKNSAVDYSAEASSSIYGLIAGLDLPLGFRAWGGYVLDGILDPQSSNSYDVVFRKAKGPILGAGFKFILVSFNLEYFDMQYDDSVLETAAGITANTAFDNKLKNKLTIFSVSLPIGI